MNIRNKKNERKKFLEEEMKKNLVRRKNQIKNKDKKIRKEKI